jgi:dipeptidyl aminopeptidase/acylaminoacyl peptidase
MNPEQRVARPTAVPFGEWRSPITAERIAAGSLRLSDVALDGDAAYWLEGRPAEGGRSALVRCGADGRIGDVTPAPFDVRTRVHEYGGGAWLVNRGTVWFANGPDQRLYRQRPGESAQPLTRQAPWRFADLVLDGMRRRLIAVREDHERAGEPTNALVAVDERTGAVQVLTQGHDFYSNPRPSPDGHWLAWVTWDHPRMPWDGTELWVAPVTSEGTLGAARRVAGGPEEAVFQPEWAADGTLYFVSDPTGWWNLYRWRGATPTPVCPVAAEFGLPQWQFGMRTYGFDGAGAIVCAYCLGGVWRLARLRATGTLEPLDLPYTQFQGLRVAGRRAMFVGGAPERPAAVVSVDLASDRCTTLRESVSLDLDAGYISRPQRIEFPTAGGAHAHALLYSPRHPRHPVPPGAKPPLIVVGHGGPTGATSDTLRLAVQFWCSRGFAVLDVDYRGSTGYGRAYRRLLEGRWGVADVEDCVRGARHVVATGRADGERLIIRGSSAGGYTTLAALTFTDVFTAGASYYGIGDLEALACETHKFESHYLDALVGPYPAARELYRERSPLHHVERLCCPVIFFQGLEDKVVPPTQAEAMVAALRRRGLPVAYLAFEGEQHGFRKSETVRRTLEAELYFYGRVFGFQPADPVDPIPIDNLP